MIGRDRHIHSHATLRDVPLPSHPKHGIPFAHKKAVADFGGRFRIGRTHGFLKSHQHRFAAAVADFIQQAAVGFGKVFWLE